MIALHLPSPDSAALIVAALLVAADHTEPDPTAHRMRNLAIQIGDGLDALPAPHTNPED